jgi:hypothetical protein
MYAFAECEDGTFAFWAAGKAGWFETQGPASSFKATYNKMEEAASIFYMLADELRRAHKRVPKLTSKSINEYASQIFEDVNQPCYPSGSIAESLQYLANRGIYAHMTDVDDVCEAFQLHREFLVTSMIEGQDGLDWTDTPIWNYFKLKFPVSSYLTLYGDTCSHVE